MKRVMVVGGPGSGKSTLAAQLGRVTGLPVFHMDNAVHWLPGWVERSKEEKTRLALEIEAREEWIFEGGHSTTYASRAARADTIIWLDLPLILRLFRVYKRRWQYRGGKTRPDLPENCPEKVDWEFLSWILFTRKSQRKKIVQCLANADHADLYHLRSRHAVTSFLSEVANG